MQPLPIFFSISFYFIGLDTTCSAPVENPVATPISMTPQWNNLSEELYGSVNEITINDNDIYVGGNFIAAGGTPDADYLARWDGCQWHAVGPGLDGTVRAIAIDGNDIYVGGEFAHPYPNIARWDGNQWHPLGSGPLEIVNSIVIDAGEIIVGCGYWNSGFVSKWNGTAWQTLGPVLNGRVNAVAKNGSDLYAAGNFTNVNGNADADGIVKWNGSTWLNLGTGVPVTNTFVGIREILFYGDDLYIGGVFINAGGNPDADEVAVWNGNNWSNLGIMPPTFLGLFPITIFNGYLYTAAGAGWSPETDGIYRWNLTTEIWELFELTETGPDDPLLILESDNDNLYVGGYNMIIDGYVYGGLVRWGEPFPNEITITGVPDVICQTDPPIPLPTTQNGYTGIWDGMGVTNNIFNPSGLSGIVMLTFIPDVNICSADFYVTVHICYAPSVANWIWAKTISGDNVRDGTGIPVVCTISSDLSNAAYTTGYFEGEVDFDPGPNEYWMTASGVFDGFICKLNDDGNFEWAKQIGGAGSGAIPYSIDLDEDGNIFITGGFSNHVDFDPGPQSHFLYSIGEGDIFILKLNQNGEFLWVKQMGGAAGANLGSHIQVAGSTGDLYLTGTHSGITDFDPDTASYNLGNLDQEYNIFIAKLDSNGNFIWAKEIQGPTAFHITMGTSLAIDAGSGNIYAAGHFFGTCDFDPGPGIDSITSNGDADIFLLKLDSSGNYLWAHQFGGTGDDYRPAVALGSPGNEKVYVSGGFSGTIDFDPGPGTFNLTSAEDLFICKLNNAGDFIWAKSLGGSSGLTSTGSYLKVDPLRNESVYTSGGFTGTADFDPGPDQVNMISMGSSDVYVTKIDSSGNFIWVKTAGGTGNDYSVSSTIQSEGKILTTGNYDSPTLAFDGITLTNVSDPCVFVAKLGGCTTVVTNTNNSGGGSLRDVIQCAQSGDLVTFDLPQMSQITLTTGEIVIGKNLTLLGPGINNLTISGNNNSRIFYLPSNTNFHVESLALKDSYAAYNGGAILARGNLTFQNVGLENNFQSSVPKSLTLNNTSHLTIKGMVDLKE